MIILNYTRSFQALDTYIAAYNESQEGLGQQIRQNVKTTAQNILRYYGKALLKATAVEEYGVENLPPLATNNVQLSDKGTTSTRTIQRHLKRLIEAGVITRKVWHGTNASYELWINPKVLGINPKFAEKLAREAAAKALAQTLEKQGKPVIKEEQKTSCPYTDTGNKGNNIYNSVIVGDNSEPSTSTEISDELDEGKRCPHARTVESEKGHIRKGDTGEKVTGSVQKTGEKARAIFGEDDVPPPGGTDEPGRRASLLFYRDMLWTLARNTLYQGVYLTERQQQAAKALILQWYEPVTTASLARIHETYVTRISLVRKYVAKDPENRFVQLPNRFFDPQNESGLAGTKRWFEAHQKRTEELRVKLILNQQIRKYQKNLKQPPEKQKSPIAVMRACETRLGKLKVPGLVDVFYASILQPEAYQLM